MLLLTCLALHFCSNLSISGFVGGCTGSGCCRFGKIKFKALKNATSTSRDFSQQGAHSEHLDKQLLQLRQTI